MKITILVGFVFVLMIFCSCVRHVKQSAREETTVPTDLERAVAPKLKAILPPGWSLDFDGAAFVLRRDEKAWLYNPIGLPLGRKLDDNLEEFGLEKHYEIRLRFAARLTEPEYEKLKRERAPYEKIVNDGAPAKSAYADAVEGFYEHRVPVYYTDTYSIFAEKSDAFPLRIYPDSVAIECKEVIERLDGLFRRYAARTGKRSDF